MAACSRTIRGWLREAWMSSSLSSLCSAEGEVSCNVLAATDLPSWWADYASFRGNATVAVALALHLHSKLQAFPRAFPHL